MDTILQCVNSAKKYSERLEVKDYFASRKQRTKAMKLLVESRKDYKQQVEAVKTIVKSPHDAQKKWISLKTSLKLIPIYSPKMKH